MECESATCNVYEALDKLFTGIPLFLVQFYHLFLPIFAPVFIVLFYFHYSFRISGDESTQPDSLINKLRETFPHSVRVSRFQRFLRILITISSTFRTFYHFHHISLTVFTII